MTFCRRSLAPLLLALAAAAGIAVTAVAEDAARPLPASLAPKLARLSPAQRQFLDGGRALQFAGTRDKLVQALEGRSAEEVEAYVAGMMSVVEAARFHPGEDPAAIPLNTDSPTFNQWKTRRPRAFDPERKPGPFSLHRYVQSPSRLPWGSGIPTFADAPVALTPEDLRAGKVDVAFVGAPLDMGSGWRGAKHGPLALRAMSGLSGNDMGTMVNPGEVLNIVDYGDIAVDNMSTERSVGHVREMVREIAQTGAIPFVIGGDHSLEYPNVAAITDVYGKGKVGVVHFDAHYDAAGPESGAHLISHGQPIYRLIQEGHVSGRNYIQVGLRGEWPGPEAFKWMREQGLRYHTMAEVEKRGWPEVMKRALAEARQGAEYLYISFDIDVLDPVFTTGTGTPVPGGLMIREALPLVRRLCAENNVVGFDLVEVAPVLDSTYKTALNANYVLNACLAGITLRRLGVTEENYLSPLATDHD